MVDFLADTLGENYEVVLHDLRRLENSIVALRNSHVTGRRQGDTITDYGLQILRHSDDYRDCDYVANYTGKTTDGRKKLRSSTCFIKDDDGSIFGMLCVNIDVTALARARDYLDALLLTPKEDQVEKQEEHFIPNIKELVNSVTNNVLCDQQVNRMSIDEKKQAVEQLESSGVFLLKGAVCEVAIRLEVSEQTIYRYLKELEQKSKSKEGINS